MFGATDWVLKRLAKFLLKRTLGRLLHPDVDLDLLEVALGSGSLAMHRVLLDCDRVNELLVCVSAAEATGRVMVLTISVAFSGLRQLVDVDIERRSAVSLYHGDYFCLTCEARRHVVGCVVPSFGAVLEQAPRHNGAACCLRQEWSGWELRAGFLGTVRVTVPLTALYTEACSVDVHEALITVRPRPPGSTRRASADASSGATLHHFDRSAAVPTCILQRRARAYDVRSLW